MSASRVIGHSARILVAIAILVLAAVAVPSIGDPTVASAQTEIICPGGVTLAANQICPSQYLVCPGGVTLPANDVCGSSAGSVTTNGSTIPPGATVYTCWNGSVITQNQSCPPSPSSFTCPDGSIAPPGQSCGTTSTSLFTCPDGSTIFLGAGTACPTYTVCPGGIGVAVGLNCTTTGSSFLCPNGTIVSSSLLCSTTTAYTVSLPAGQYIPIQNTGSTMATVTGADVVLVYNPATNSYFQSTQLAPGQSGFALSNNGGVATITYAAV